MDSDNKEMVCRVETDACSGFCFGVVNAIRKAEDQLEQNPVLYCLGDIVHNTMEVNRLRQKGLHTLTHSEMESLRDARILFRAHGEPPATYGLARNNRLEIIDATCPVVLHLQKRIRKKYEEGKNQSVQLLIFGKIGHAEVNGLVGQTDNTAIVIEHPSQLDAIDFGKPIVLFSQTTKSQEDYAQLIAEIEKRLQPGVSFEHFDTICKHFASRLPRAKEFALAYDCLLFVSDPKSSNGKALFKACLESNPHSHFISSAEELQPAWFDGMHSVGICGATSTPQWLMEEIRQQTCRLMA